MANRKKPAAPFMAELISRIEDRLPGVSVWIQENSLFFTFLVTVLFPVAFVWALWEWLKFKLTGKFMQ